MEIKNVVVSTDYEYIEYAPFYYLEMKARVPGGNFIFKIPVDKTIWNQLRAVAPLLESS